MTFGWGVVLGLGLVSVWSWWLSRQVSVGSRLTLGRDPLSTFHQVVPWGPLEGFLRPVWADAMAAMARWGTSADVLRGRLQAAGSAKSVDEFRAEQVVWALATLIATSALAVAWGLTRPASAVAMTLLVVTATLCAPLLREWLLGRAISARHKTILAELPTVAELMALSVSAGESVLGAVERLTRTTSGVLSGSLSLMLARVRTGTPVVEALNDLGQQSAVPALRRFTDAIATAIERGTPLAEVLRAQAQDVRVDTKRALMEQGGKKEITMMIPVVFLILPVTVIFAVFPGMVALQLGT